MEILELMKQRHSVRQYKDTAVEKSQRTALNHLVEEINRKEGLHLSLIHISLRSRCFEPDAPNYTPRISGILHLEDGGCNYALSILKSSDGNPESCHHFTFAYKKPLAGEGRLIHTYLHDGNPLPSFEGEPKRVVVKGDLDSLTRQIWESLDSENRVSLFVRMIDLGTGNYESKIVNKNQ